MNPPGVAANTAEFRQFRDVINAITFSVVSKWKSYFVNKKNSWMFAPRACGLLRVSLEYFP